MREPRAWFVKAIGLAANGLIVWWFCCRSRRAQRATSDTIDIAVMLVCALECIDEYFVSLVTYGAG